jgi:tetratricopeptide (TPR) repeat protein
MIETVLLIDKDRNALESLENFFHENGFKDVSKLETGESAWSILQEKQFDLVVSSWELYELSGLNLLKIIRRDSRFWETTFFLTKSNFSREDVIRAGQAGVSGLIVSPFNSENFLKKIKSSGEDNNKIKSLELSRKLEKGLALMESGDLEKSLEVLNELLKLGETAEVYYNIGYIKAAQEKFSEAVEAFKMATAIDRLHAKAYKALGSLYSKLGNSEMAKMYLEKAAEIYLSSEKDQEAEDVLNEVIKINPDTQNAYNSLGVLYRKKNENEKALSFYKKALKIQPDGAHVYYNIAKLYLHMKDFENAKIHIKKALEFNPGYDDLALILKKLENK